MAMYTCEQCRPCLLRGDPAEKRYEKIGLKSSNSFTIEGVGVRVNTRTEHEFFQISLFKYELYKPPLTLLQHYLAKDE